VASYDREAKPKPGECEIVGAETTGYPMSFIPQTRDIDEMVRFAGLSKARMNGIILSFQTRGR